MKKAILFLMILIMPLAVAAQTPQKKALYFYSETCVHCVKVNEYFQSNGIYDKYEIKKVVVDSPENFSQLNKFFDAFGVESEKRGYPVIFFDTKMLIGDQSIIDNFVRDIEAVEAANFPDPESLKSALEQQKKAGATVPAGESANISLPILVGAALVDAINPCAFAVLILLVATVLSSSGKRRALMAGLLFSLSVFISYFLMGLGLYKTITVFNLPQIISIVVGVIAILIGLANLKDAFWHGKFFVMEVPFSWRPKMQAILKHVTSPLGALGAGFLVSLFLLPCTSGPYIVVLGLLAEKENLSRTISLLFLYNFIFVLPMVLITLGMYFGLKLGKLDEIRKNNVKLLHAVAGAVMLFIGVYLLSEWL
ncbi:MAG: cytochrome c biogenesis protein [Parcubacteria group bacterium]|jgi:cytochrome c biogenesis protein CcdA/glutaredoxin-related protein